jgi:cysteine-S-conjugate beta-lyase
MKTYNFDEIINRENTQCEKYDSRERIFGNKDVIPLWVADTDFRTPDFIVDAIRKRADHEIYGYPIKPDSYYLSIQNWLLSQHGWHIEKEWINYCPNVVIGLASLVLSLTEPGDKIVVQTPVYFPFFHVVKGNHRELVENPLQEKDGRYYFNLDDLRSKVDARTKMLILCSPHNPGGMVWTKDELTSLGEFCLEHNIIVVSDEIHSDLVYSGHKHIPFASISDAIAKNCITTMAASKTFNVAGLSSAYLIIENDEFRRKYNRFMYATHISSGNFFGLVATEAAYTHGHNWLQQLLDYLEENYRLVESFFSERLPHIKPMKPEGTYLVWIDFRATGIDNELLFRKITDAGVGLSPGNLFGKNGEGFMRLNMGCPRSVLFEALLRIEKAFEH